MTSSTVPNEPPAILVVEDDAIIAWDIQQTLQRLGYAVPTTAPSFSSRYG